MITTIDDDKNEYPTVFIACGKCKHYVNGHKCKAFPGGIPEDILTGEFDHKESHEGDHGIQFEPVG